MSKPFFFKNPLLRDRVVHALFNVIQPKVNVIARMDFEFIYFEPQYFSYCAMGTLPID